MVHDSRQTGMTGRGNISVLLNNIRSMHNVGSVFRTSDGAGINHVYLCGYTPYPPRKEISKTALNADETVSWSYHLDAKALIQKLKEENTEILALELTEDSIDYREYLPNKSTCLILGHEREGVGEELLQLTDKVIKLPMRGKKESLNVSVAYGVAAYELTRNIKS